MAAPSAVRICGLSTGDEYRNPEFGAAGPAAFDGLRRFFLVDSSSNWLTAAKAINTRGEADKAGRIAGQFAQMYCVDFNIENWLGNYAEVSFEYEGRLDTTDDKKTRVINGGAQSVTADEVDFTYGQMPAGISTDPGSAQGTYDTNWTRDSWGNFVDENMVIAQGEITLTDTWVSQDSNLQDFVEYVNFQRPDNSGNPVEPGDSGFMPGGDPITPPQNPWKSWSGNYVINWPYGWVLQNRSTLGSAGSFSSGTPGQIHIIREVWRYIHKHTVR
jgi:hypothetical protein